MTLALAALVALPFGAITYWSVWQFFPHMHLSVVLSLFFPSIVWGLFTTIFVLLIERRRERRVPQAELFFDHVRLRDATGAVVTVAPGEITRI